MGVPLIIVLQEGDQTLLKVFGRVKVAAAKEASRQDTEPEFDLVEP